MRFIKTAFLLLILLSVGGIAISAKGQSVLQSGEWFKMAVDNDGVYKITYSFLRKAGLNPDEIDPRKIKIYGNGGGMLPQSNMDSRPVDLLENAIFVSGESDGKFNKEDFILFYAEGADKIVYQASRNVFEYQNNLYSDNNYYFLTVSDASILAVMIS